MAAINLEFEPSAQVLVLRGASVAILRDPLFAAYTRKCAGMLSSDGSLNIPTTTDELADRFSTIKKILARLGVSPSLGVDVGDALKKIEEDDSRFLRFSKDAFEIWNNQLDTASFREFVATVEKTCPGRTFYRKQLLSAFHLAFAHNACNFSVPGAGKTSIVYAAFAFLKSLPRSDTRAIDRLLIVGPLSSFKAWEDEYKEIFLQKPNSKRLVASMPAEKKVEYLHGIDPDSRRCELTLTSYPTIASLEEEFRVFLRNPATRTMMVLDEAHYIKRDDGFWAAAVLKLAPLAASRVVLTGTPAPNGYEDLSNLFKFIYPARDVVGFPLPSLRAMTDGAMKASVLTLKANIQPFFTRIRKSDLGLPAAREERVPVDMSDTQELIYRSLERRVIPQLRAALNSNQSAPARLRARLIRLRQACVNPELLLRPIEADEMFDVPPGSDFSIAELEIAGLVREFNSREDLVRAQVCCGLVSDILRAQGKVLIWSYFLGNLTLLAGLLKDSAPFVEVLTGATPIADGDPEEADNIGTREEIITRFHQTSQAAILIANPQAVGESISLHKACRSAIYFDRDFNAGRFIQSRDRIHRYNPAGGKEVVYYHLVSAGTIDNDIDVRLSIKERRLSELIDASDIPLLTAGDDETADDIKQILDAYERRKAI